MTSRPKRRVPYGILRRLERIEEVAAFEQASFGTINQMVTLDDGTRISVDELVKSQTRLYRETWLLPPIRNLIDWANGEISADAV